MMKKQYGFIINLIFALFNGVIGIINHSLWAGIMAVYYVLLGLMRFYARLNDRRNKYGQRMKKMLYREIAVYHNCSILLLLMALPLAVAVVLLVTAQGGKHYPGFTIYAFALYAFIKITLAVKNRIKASMKNEPILIAVQNIDYVEAMVSILMLQTALLETFGMGTGMTAKGMAAANAATGSVVCLLTLGTGIFGIKSSGKMRKGLRDGTFGKNIKTGNKTER